MNGDIGPAGRASCADLVRCQIARFNAPAGAQKQGAGDKIAEPHACLAFIIGLITTARPRGIIGFTQPRQNIGLKTGPVIGDFNDHFFG